MTARPSHFDLIVIGAGTAGSACWFEARRRGLSVAVFEQGVLGGECPTFACMPTKALLHCAEVYEQAKGGARFGVDATGLRFDYARIKARKDEVVSHTGAAQGEKPYVEMGVTLVRQAARFVADDTVEAGGERFSAERILIATGSRQRIPPVQGLEKAGYLTFKEAIDLERAPSSLLVLGGGAVGCEFSHLFSAFGTRVYLCDRNERLLHLEDAEAGDFLAGHLRRRGVEVLLGANLRSVSGEADGRRVVIESGGRQRSLLVEQVLVATGKAPNLDLDLEQAGVQADERGVVVDETLRSSNPRVYAAGDVAGPYRFTHAASYQGSLACHNMFSTEKKRVDYRAMPRCVFTSPEVVSVGMRESEAAGAGVPVRSGRAEMSEVDRALTSGAQAGFVKVIAGETGRLLGGLIVAERAGELAGELGLAIQLGATAEQVANTVHAFPTYNEGLAIACSRV